MAFCTGPIPVRVALYVKWPFVQARFQCVLHYTLYGLLYRPDSSANCTKKLFHTWNAIPKSAIWWHHSCSRICFQQIRNAIPTWDAHISPAWPAVLSKPCLHENSKGFLQFTIAIMHVHNWHEHILFQIAQKQQFHKKKSCVPRSIHAWWNSKKDLDTDCTLTQLLPDASCKTNFNGKNCHPCIYSHWFAFIHGSTDIWNSNVYSAAARCQLQNKLKWKQNCHPVIYSHWFAFIHFI